MAVDHAAILKMFHQHFGRSARVTAAAPGRVNLIGEHTDYNEGHVLPLAINRTVVAAAAPASRGCDIRVRSLDCDEEDSFSPAEVESLRDGDWRNYVRGAAWALVQAGHELPPLDVTFAGDVPIGAGLSSSAALEVAVAAAIAAASGLDVAPRELALLAQRAENGFVGVQCGVMDQLVAVCGQADRALLIDCRSLDVEPVRLRPSDQGITITVVDSAVRRALDESPYNQRRRECARAAETLGVASLRDVSAEELERHQTELPPALYRRARHVVGEEERVMAAVAALRHGDLKGMGRLLFESHESMRDDFETSCPETDRLVELAMATDGVLGARLTGAGFGGCTVNLVREAALPSFERDVVQAYREETGLPAEMHVVDASDGLQVNRA